MAKKRIAIACQGGGSQTAFTAGVLRSFFAEGVHESHEIVSFSGTSGGAICATLAWYSLLKAAKGDTTPLGERLLGFWRDNSTQNEIEEFFNDLIVGSVRMVDHGLLPEWKLSPGSAFGRSLSANLAALLPRKQFFDLAELLEAHIDFDELDALVDATSPVLLIGAANVKTGHFKKFSSRKREIRLDALQASAAVPAIFPAVQVGGAYYWDGLFSDNPPTDELIDKDFVGRDRIPDELWIIQINPRECARVPDTPAEISDRRNEMICNESLFQDLKHIELVNKYVDEGAFTDAYLAAHNKKHVDIYIIALPAAGPDQLDYPSKLDRKAKYINELIAAGEEAGRRFLADPGAMQYTG